MMKSFTPPVLLWLAALTGLLFSARVSATPPTRAPVSVEWIENKGAKKEGPAGPAILWLDEATQARGGAASIGLHEAPIFHQPHDSGFGYFEKSYIDGPLWYCRMGFGNGWVPGDSISSYELKIFHSTSDDINFGSADYAVELWDGDPLSLTEIVCATAGVSAPIPGTQGIIADVPYGALVQARVELPAKVVYDCDRVWMVMTSLNGCRSAWRISGEFQVDSFNVPPDLGFGNGRGLLTGCESSTFGGACPTDTGYDAGFCCGSQGNCSGSGTACGFGWDDCPGGETCDGAEPCDHGSTEFSNPCNYYISNQTFCGDGLVDSFFADVDRPNMEHGYVGSIFAATKTYMSIVPVSVDQPPAASGSAAGVVSIGGDEVVLQDGDHNVWLEIMIGDWSPDTLAGYLAALDMTNAISSGLQGTLSRYTGDISCGECSDTSADCNSNDDCTTGSCSIAGTPCHLVSECPSGESCVGAALCAADATAYADCEAVLGRGTYCGPAGYDLGTGTCSWVYIDMDDPRWAMPYGSGLPALDVSSIDARPAYAMIFGPPAAPSPFPAEGMYAATLAVHVPSDAKGTFTIGLKPFPSSSLTGGSTAPIPLLGTIPAKITVETGRCCFDLQDLGYPGPDCRDQLQTAASCSQRPGLTLFTPGEACPDKGGPSCGCDPSESVTFDDGDACTDDACPPDGVATHTARVCNDGLICTDDDCDSDDTDGDGEGCFFTDVEVDVDDGLGCTVDSCNEADGIVHLPIDADDGDPCTVDVCLEPDGFIIHQDLTTTPNSYPCPTGDPVADGCPSEASVCLRGYCLCFPCGDDFIDPGEMCDGSDDASCFGRCRSDCQCPTCGDGVIDQGEECDAGKPGDAAADDACPGQCQSDCTCPSTIPATSHWGLAVLALLLLTGAKLYRWRWRLTAL